MKLPFEQDAEALIDRIISKQPELKDDMEKLRSWFNYHRILVNWHKKYVTFDSYASLDVLRTIKKQIKMVFFTGRLIDRLNGWVYTRVRNAVCDELNRREEECDKSCHLTPSKTNEV